ncbi:Hypothetical protein PHPALM_37276 [Phytophthora palmivora]|uniref:PiggyBac transposable element-derived protein domain-containing protein n=1 Tax=Phytophthora palmivora TaxID=4796 RepID=A0A2P4WXT3_9STRA|nr:Hypothetical protein PHPALM_37276 [Phytophthora palmivora]
MGNKVIYALPFPVGILHKVGDDCSSERTHVFDCYVFLTCQIHVINLATCMYRFEVYCCKRQTDGAIGISVTKCGPAAIIRNLREVFAANRNISIYTSPTLAMQLLTPGFYSIGTVMTNRRGFGEDIIEKRKKQEVDIERGTFTISDNKLISVIRAVCWWDNRHVHLLQPAEMLSKTELCVERKMKHRLKWHVHESRGLPDIYLALKYKKYHNSLFLGFLDQAIINAHIVYNTRREADGHKKPTHVKFLKQFHLEFIQLQEPYWEGNAYEKPRYSQAEFSRGETTFYCSACKPHSNSKKATVTRIYLCNKEKHTSNGESVSCFEIRHRHWRNGSMLPPSQRNKKIRARTISR